MKYILKILTMAVLLTSCEQDVGKYVYVDAAQSIHIDKDCIGKTYNRPGQSKEVQILLMRGVQFVDVNELHKQKYFKEYKFCPHCVTDKAYERIISIVERNLAEEDDDYYNYYY